MKISEILTNGNHYIITNRIIPYFTNNPHYSQCQTDVPFRFEATVIFCN